MKTFIPLFFGQSLLNYPTKKPMNVSHESDIEKMLIAF